MSRPVFVIVEGQTEKDFIDECLKSHWLNNYGLYDVQVRRLGVSGQKGGNVNITRLQKDVGILLKQRSEAFVTTLIDYYRIGTDMPNYAQCQGLPATDLKIDCLEAGLQHLISSDRFIPYIQKHEFESLLFSEGSSLKRYLTQDSCDAIEGLNRQFGSAEDINTANPPSYRLTEIISRYEAFHYKKVAYGSTLVLEIGIPTILDQCPRLAAWVKKIGQIATL